MGGQPCHAVYYDGKGVERYCDNHRPTTWLPERPCARCGKFPTAEGHDPCIANLPGVRAACCGHGFQGYIMFEDGRTIRWPRATAEDEIPAIKAVRLKLARRRIVAALKTRGTHARGL